MGEYATVRGIHLKLGTMDDWRYVRRDECEAWKREVEDYDLAYTLAEPSILYRFPFPWEDGATVASVVERDMFKPIISLQLSEGETLSNHDRIWKSYSGEGNSGCYNVNVAVPCLYSEEFAALVSGGFIERSRGESQERLLVNIFGERYADGVGRTIFRCYYCGAPFSLDAAEVARLSLACQADGVIERIKARAEHPANGGSSAASCMKLGAE